MPGERVDVLSRERSLPMIDVLIPVAPKDADGLGTCLAGLLRYCCNPIRAISVVSRRPPAPAVVAGHGERVRWLDEAEVVPGVAAIAAQLRRTGCAHDNASWYFQQLLKLHCLDLTGGLDYVLVVDADFAFVDEVTFVDSGGRAALAAGYPLRWQPGTDNAAQPTRPAAKPARPAPGFPTQRHSALTAASRLVPGWRPVDSFSGMQHHMVFDRIILTELRRRAERRHGLPFWQAFLATAEHAKWTGASEYVLYRHFACRYFPERTRTRHLTTVDVIQPADPHGFTLAQVVDAARGAAVQAVGCHRFLNYAGRLATMDYIPRRLRADLLANLGPLKLHLSGGQLTITPGRFPLTVP